MISLDDDIIQQCCDEITAMTDEQLHALDPIAYALQNYGVGEVLPNRVVALLAVRVAKAYNAIERDSDDR